VWWTLLKVPGRLGFIRDIREVRLPWRQGFLAKSTTLVVSGCWMLPKKNNFRAIRVFRGQPGLVGRKLKVDSRATEMCKRGGGMALSHGGFATFA
jgi:hypothetical protein